MSNRYNKELREVSYKAYETRKDIIELSALIEKSLQKELKRRKKNARIDIAAREDEYEQLFQEAVHKDLINKLVRLFPGYKDMPYSQLQ